MKDFEFQPEFAGATLGGGVVMPRELSGLSIWTQKPFSPGHAIADLFLIANDRDGSFRHLKGFTVNYKAGWCCYSTKGLADRWGWTRTRTELFLSELEKAQIIFRHEPPEHKQWLRPIELLDYKPNFTPKKEVENGTDEAADGQQTDSKQAADGQQKSTYQAHLEREKEMGMGKAKTHFPEVELPGREEFLAACSMRGIPEWRAVKEFNWRDEDPDRRWPRSNWQRAVTTLFDRWREEGAPAQPQSFRGQEKNGAAKRERGEILQQLALARKNGADGEVASLEKELETA